MISGKIHIIWFRQSTLDKAIEFGIKRYIMNLPNGNVYIETEAGYAG